jgi:PAS domain S-box-containing protein
MNTKKIRNLRTGEVIILPNPVDEEVEYDGGVMITETDTRGIITYANRKFRDMSGYSKDELIGSPHSIIRHPDMPSAAFEHMWSTIRSGGYWRGYVKNLRKDGKYYWVIVWIKPKFDDEGNIIGYIAGRKVPDRDVVEKIEESLRKNDSLQSEHLNNFAVPVIEAINEPELIEAS